MSATRGLLELTSRFVLKTNDWRGFRALYQGGYRLGLSIAATRLRATPDVAAILLRVGEDGRNWRPGLSDYDLTVLTRRLEPPRMYRFLEQFWKRYRQTKGIIPQIGETEIMDLDEYADFLAFGPMPTASIKRADPIFVRADTSPAIAALQGMRRSSRPDEVLLDALSRYIWYLLPAWLDYTSGGSTATSRMRVEHLLGNVLKRLERLGIETDRRPHERLGDALTAAFHSLSIVCNRIGAFSGEAAGLAVGGASAGLVPVSTAIESVVEQVLRESNVRECSVILWRSYMTTDRSSLAFVTSDDIAPAELEALVAVLGNLRRRTDGLWKALFTNGDLQAYFPTFSFPLVASHSMWMRWCELSPFDGAAVAESGRVLRGSEAAVPAMPSVERLKRGAQVRTAALLPLKNNWRPLDGPAPTAVYAAMTNFARGYASAATGRVRTEPEPIAFPSAEAGYRTVCEELNTLRQSLGTAGHS